MFQGADFRVLGLLALFLVAGLILRSGVGHRAPKALVPATALGEQRFLLNNDGFTVVYDTNVKSPVCVRYTLLPGRSKKPDRTAGTVFPDNRFAGNLQPKNADGLILMPLVPALALSQIYGEDIRARCYLATSMALRSDSKLAILWENTWRVESELAAATSGRVEIAAGPVFSDPAPTTNDGTSIPYAFFKIISSYATGETRAFIFPQAPVSDSLSDYLVSIEKIEMVTGIDFSEFKQPKSE